MLSICLPGINAAWYSETTLEIIGFIRFTISLEIILYAELHKLMGRKSLGVVGTPLKELKSDRSDSS